MATKSTLRPRKRLIEDAVIELKTDSPPVQILDRGFHFAAAELIKSEEISNGRWDLMHYFWPRAVDCCCAKAQGVFLEAIGRGGQP